MPVALNDNELYLSTPGSRPSLEGGVACAPVPCAKVYRKCVGMARRSAVVQPYQFDPESDPEGEAPEEIQTLRLQQDVSEWLVTNIMCLYILLFTLFVCVVTLLLTCS